MDCKGPSLRRTICGVVAAILAMFLHLAADADAPTFPLWRQLKPGNYGCGFKSQWLLDYGRTYQTNFADKSLDHYASGKSPRPILINLWYPTKSSVSQSAMPYRDYLRIRTEHGPLTRFSSDLAAYARKVILDEVFYKEEAKLTASEKSALQALMDTRTAAYRDAPAAPGRFPLVIYHAGYGSSFEDNSVLCEYLASQGYVVIGSAFQKLDGASLNIEGGVRTAGDIRFLLTFAHGLPFVDWSSVGMVGHSGGAQAAIIYQTEPGCAIDATVSLDTTEDYYSLADPRWNYMTDPVKVAIADLKRPILFMAGPNAGFEMADSMRATPRYLYTVDALNHDDFITHGSLARWVKLRLASDRDRQAATDDANLIWNRYESVCRTILHFFDATLKRQPASLETQIAQDRTARFPKDHPHLEYVTVGAAGPEPYSAAGTSAPTPRQVRLLLRTQGVDAAVTALRRWWQPEADSPAYDDEFAFALVFELEAQGKNADAKALYQFYGSIGRTPSKLFLALGRYYLHHGVDVSFARSCLGYLLILDPANKEAAAELSPAAVH